MEWVKTKRNPKKAAEQSLKTIKKDFASTSHKNKFLLNFVSGPGSIKIPGQGYRKVVDSGIISKFIVQAFGISQYLVHKVCHPCRQNK